MAGVCFRSAPLAMLERTGYRAEDLGPALSRLLRLEDVVEAALLSTCNRTEAYAVFADGLQADRLGRFLAADHGLPWASVERHLCAMSGEQAVRHLFEVAAGLDSMVVGEVEILGQVRAAYAAALQAGAVGPHLAALFPRAVAVGRRIRRETSLGAVRRSLGRTAVDLAAAARGGLGASTLLVIGTGKVARSVVDRALESRIAHLIVCGRTEERAAILAGSSAEVLPFNRLHAGLVRADAVICCTAAHDQLIGQEDLTRVMSARDQKPLLLIDLSVPRAVQPEAGSVPGVRLLDLQGLGEDAIQDAAQLSTAVQRGREITQAEARQFSAWSAGRQPIPDAELRLDKIEQ